MSDEPKKCNNRVLPTRAHIKDRKNVTPQKPSNNTCQQSCPYKAARHWNKLPTILHLDLKKDKFKEMAKDCIISGRLKLEYQ